MGKRKKKRRERRGRKRKVWGSHYLWPLGSVYIYLRWKRLCNLGTLPNWHHGAGKDGDQLNEVQIYTQTPAFVPIHFNCFCFQLTFVTWE